jgi:hypothetical protein
MAQHRLIYLFSLCQVKIDKQNRRLLKKQMKMAYKDEESRQNGIVGRQQAINNVGVFKYSL